MAARPLTVDGVPRPRRLPADCGGCDRRACRGDRALARHRTRRLGAARTGSGLRRRRAVRGRVRQGRRPLRALGSQPSDRASREPPADAREHPSRTTSITRCCDHLHPRCSPSCECCSAGEGEAADSDPPRLEHDNAAFFEIVHDRGRLVSSSVACRSERRSAPRRKRIAEGESAPRVASIVAKSVSAETTMCAAPGCRSGRYESRVVSLVSSSRRRRPGSSSRGCRGGFDGCRRFSNLQVRRLLRVVS